VKHFIFSLLIHEYLPSSMAFQIIVAVFMND